MTRIIAGFAGSLALAVPRTGTRPTSDRVREAIFSALEARGGLHGLVVLDLYAGSGALALEAVSRGAAHAVLVEKNAAAARIAKQNAATVTAAAARDARPRVEVVVQAVLPRLRAEQPVAGAGYDVVFIDPPYDLPDAELAETLSALVPLLDADATVLVERSSRSPEPDWPRGLELDRSKSYGETVLWWASPVQPAPSA
ncbi:16S rRNA (guanine(966)-N(2))-methyltransferase RsmD [Herbiconiux sp. P18]|uniref:16S rRNA (guanine(966)-N(2))-methyltransferase RsmD n=1 Tax=Herbiconiux liangxiaofengii TaxID=3342795 RepID=UPI0035B7C573